MNGVRLERKGLGGIIRTKDIYFELSGGWFVESVNLTYQGCIAWLISVGPISLWAETATSRVGHQDYYRMYNQSRINGKMELFLNFQSIDNFSRKIHYVREGFNGEVDGLVESVNLMYQGCIAWLISVGPISLWAETATSRVEHQDYYRKYIQSRMHGNMELFWMG